MVARSPRASGMTVPHQLVAHEHPVPTGMAVRHSSRILMSFLSYFRGYSILAFESTFLKTLLGFLEILLERVFGNQIVRFKVVQEFSFDFNPSLFPKFLSLLLLLLSYMQFMFLPFVIDLVIDLAVSLMTCG